MKRCIFLVLIMALAAGSMFAQDAGQWTIGARLGPTLGFHSPGGDMDDQIEVWENWGVDVSKKMKVNFNIAFYGNYAFSDKLSLQPELNFMVNQGLKYKFSVFGQSVTAEVFYKSLDIPVLVKYELMDAPVVAGILGGPHLSFPLGDGTMAFTGSQDLEGDLKGIGFGVTLGGYMGYPLGPGRIVGDLRFIFDFTTVKGDDGIVDDYEYLKRRGLAFTVGYEISL